MPTNAESRPKPVKPSLAPAVLDKVKTPINPRSRKQVLTLLQGYAKARVIDKALVQRVAKPEVVEKPEVIDRVSPSQRCCEDLLQAWLDAKEMSGYLLITKAPNGEWRLEGSGDYREPSSQSVRALTMALQREQDAVSGVGQDDDE